MKQVVFERYGPPARVAECVSVNDAPAPGDYDVTVKIQAAAINPSDLSVLRGQYGMLPKKLPANIGLEAAGVITAIGSEVEDFAIGDTVIVIANENWCQYRTVQHNTVFKVPAGMDVLQATMVKTNALCAYLMIDSIVELEPGDTIVQSGPLSAVGRMIIGFSKALGYKTVNIVRRPDAVREVHDIGGDLALIDGEDLAERVIAATGATPRPLGLDCVAGDITQRMADCLDTSATLVNYGMLSNEACVIRPDHTIFKDIRLQGFWLSKVLNRMPLRKRTEVFSKCTDLMIKNGLTNQISKTFALEDIAEAIEFAEDPARQGKVLLLPNGEIT